MYRDKTARWQCCSLWFNEHRGRRSRRKLLEASYQGLARTQSGVHCMFSVTPIRNNQPKKQNAKYFKYYAETVNSWASESRFPRIFELQSHVIPLHCMTVSCNVVTPIFAGFQILSENMAVWELCLSMKDPLSWQCLAPSAVVSEYGLVWGGQSLGANIWSFIIDQRGILKP